MTQSLFRDGLFILSATVFVMSAAMKGQISEGMTVFVLISFVVIRAAAHIPRSGISHVTRLTFGIGMPLASLALLAISFGNGSVRETGAILGGVLAVVLVLFGISLMIRGPFMKKK